MENRLRILRSERTWSQSDLAARLSVSRQTVHALEAGKSEPGLALAFRIARLFDLRVEEVFFPEEPQKPALRVVDVPEPWRAAVRIVSDVAAADVEEFLTAAEREDLERLRVTERRLERAASRIAGKLLIAELHGVVDPMEIEFTKEGDRPLALVRGEPAPFAVSFTHSGGLGAAAIGATAVGVDLERIRAIRPEMTRFFLTDNELAAAGDTGNPEALLHFWSAKEAAFKATDRFPTLLRVPLRLATAESSGLTFVIDDPPIRIETRVVNEAFIAALASLP